MNIDTSQIPTFIRAHAWIALAAILVGFVVRLLKSDVPIVPTVAARYRPFAALALGQVAAVLQAIAAGAPALDAIVGGVIAAATAIVGHDLVIEGIRAGKELPIVEPSTPPSGGGAGLAAGAALLMALLGCAGPVQQQARAVVAVAEPKLEQAGDAATSVEHVVAAAYRVAQETCPAGPAGDACIASTRARWAPVWRAYDGLVDSWNAADHALDAVSATVASGSPADILAATQAALHAVQSVIDAQAAFVAAFAAARGGA